MVRTQKTGVYLSNWEIDQFSNSKESITPCNKPYIINEGGGTMKLPSCSKLMRLHEWDLWLVYYVKLRTNLLQMLMEEALKEEK